MRQFEFDQAALNRALPEGADEVRTELARLMPRTGAEVQRWNRSGPVVIEYDENGKRHVRRITDEAERLRLFGAEVHRRIHDRDERWNKGNGPWQPADAEDALELIRQDRDGEKIVPGWALDKAWAYLEARGRRYAIREEPLKAEVVQPSTPAEIADELERRVCADHQAIVEELNAELGRVEYDGIVIDLTQTPAVPAPSTPTRRATLRAGVRFAVAAAVLWGILLAVGIATPGTFVSTVIFMFSMGTMSVRKFTWWMLPLTLAQLGLCVLLGLAVNAAIDTL